MNAIIRQTKSREKVSYGHSVVYTECALTKLVDNEFFNKHEVYNLDFKCKTWTALCNYVNKQTIASLQVLFPGDTIKFSAKAGCNCGCSPGFRVTHHNPNTRGRYVWVDVECEESELETTRKALAFYNAKLQFEIAANNKENK